MEESTLARSIPVIDGLIFTTDIGWGSKTMNSKTVCVIANAFKLSFGNFLCR